MEQIIPDFVILFPNLIKRGSPNLSFHSLIEFKWEIKPTSRKHFFVNRVPLKRKYTFSYVLLQT